MGMKFKNESLELSEFSLRFAVLVATCASPNAETLLLHKLISEASTACLCVSKLRV